MHVKIAPTEATILLRKHFGLQPPITHTAFRKRYRELAFEYHPDHAGSSATQRFQTLQDAYEKIRATTALFAPESADIGITEQTVEGVALHELGLGLGPSINAVECKPCAGKGYETTYGARTVYCGRCDDEGRPLQQCPQCRGSKGFTALDGHTHIQCWTCNDSGTILKKANVRQREGQFNWLFNNRFVCSYCHGTKRRVMDKDKKCPIYHKCLACLGTGEIRIYNPVIPKGRLGIRGDVEADPLGVN